MEGRAVEVGTKEVFKSTEEKFAVMVGEMYVYAGDWPSYITLFKSEEYIWDKSVAREIAKLSGGKLYRVTETTTKTRTVEELVVE